MKIYMFHYVTRNFNYPHFDLNYFDKKIDELKRKYKIISLSDINNQNLKNCNKELLLLTFDDGTIDHYNEVFPILKKHNVSGVFFINSNSENNHIFSAHYIHKLLSVVDIKDLHNTIIELDSKKFQNYMVSNNSGYDNDITYKVKRFLQEEDNRNILKKIIEIYKISTNYNDYYISVAQIKEMKSQGMEFGMHTQNHKRLSQLSYDEQYNEVKENYEFFIKHNIFSKVKSLSFPFGEYNDNTINIANKLGINYLFGIDGIGTGNDNILFRLDCNVLKE